MRKKRLKKVLKHRVLPIILVFTGVILILSGLLSSFRYQQFSSTDGFTPVSVKQVIFSENSATIYLQNGCSQLSIIVSVSQGQSIQLALNQLEEPRPGTHDIISDILEMYNIEPTAAKITKLQGSTYFAKLLLSNWNKFLSLDIRPSDAIAIALRTQTPIYAADNLLESVC